MNDTQERIAQLTVSLKTRERWLVGIESTAFFAVILTAFLGNTMLNFAFYKTRALLRSPQNYYLISLAVADILNAAVCMPITLAVIIKGTWSFGDFTCQFQGALISICSSITLITLGMIAVTRYVKICRSASLYQKLFNKRNVLKSIAISWIFSAFFVFGAFFVRKRTFHFHPGKCVCFLLVKLTDSGGIYNTINYSIFVSLSFPPIAFSYYKVLRKIRAHFVQVRSSTPELPSTEQIFTETSRLVPLAPLFTMIKTRPRSLKKSK